MSQFSITKKPTWDANGKAYDANDYETSPKGWVYTPTGEVVAAIRGLAAKATDAGSVPTFTYTGPTAGNYVTDAVLTFTLAASEAVSVVGTPRIALTIGASTVYAVYSAADSTGTSLVFKHIVDEAELDTNGITVSTTLDKNGAKIYDTVGQSGVEISGAITYVVPADVITVNNA